MPVTHTNRKGVTYFLCRSTTKKGKPRFVFAREPKAEPVEEIPEGYAIRESVNGVVSLARERPVPFRPEEIARVEAAVGSHPKQNNYRINVRHDWIEIHERLGPDADELGGLLGRMGMLVAGKLSELQELQDKHAQFSPVLRLRLVDEERRVFEVQRMCYLGSMEGWIHIGAPGPLGKLVGEWIPLLGTDELFEVDLF